MDDKQKILNYATERFLKEGFRSITMDEIASALGMSKKTLYKYFPSKNDLIWGATENIMLTVRGRVEKLVPDEGDAILKFYYISRAILELVMRISQNWLDDISRMPDLWEKVEEFRRKTIFENFSKIIRQGKEEGYIIDQPDIIMLTIFTSVLRNIINPEFIIQNNFSAREAGEITLDILINGMVTKKGRRLFKKYKSGKLQ